MAMFAAHTIEEYASKNTHIKNTQREMHFIKSEFKNPECKIRKRNTQLSKAPLDLLEKCVAKRILCDMQRNARPLHGTPPVKAALF
jgi:hypothetical protein